MTSSIGEEISVKEGLNEYFKLKFKYEEEIMKNKKKIINNILLSNKEKRSEYLKLKPKCINCKKPGGTIFETVYFPHDETDDSTREYRARCGVLSDPCNLDIKIKLYKVELLADILSNFQNDIKNYKNNIIDEKNKLLFGFIDTEKALEQFDRLKEDVNLTSSLYEEYLMEYNNIFENPEKKIELDESITNSYIYIQQIKECIVKMNDTGNVQFARDAVTIYVTLLSPLLIKIRNLKYSENMVVYDEQSNTFNLLQNKNNLEKLNFSISKDKVVAYNVGYSAIKKPSGKKGKQLVIESSSSPEEEEEEEIEEFNLPIQSGEIPKEEPIYGEGIDGITWRNKEYSNLWEKMPKKLKNSLIPNHEWLSEFMFQCVNNRSKGKPCVITTPTNIKLPPIKTANGQYDFGIQIYNDIFNKLPKTLQETYLTLFSEKDGFKDYKMLENTMNELIAKEVGFEKGFI